MPSQFFGLYIAGSGLRAANAALNTTANNISNAQTTGYSRQQVTQQANNALRTFTTYGCAGAGVDTIAIERVRDSFYDVKYWDNHCKFGEYSVKQYYTGMLEDYFDDNNTSGFTAIFNKFSAALQSVTTNSSSAESKQQFIAAAKSLTDYFNNMYGNLQELQRDINLEIKQSIDEINSIAQKIAVLNKQINTIELSGARANELRDQRDLLVDELSEYVDVDVTETPVKDLNNADRETGANRYVVRIAGKQALVDGNDYHTISYVARGKDEKVNQTDADGLYRFMWDNGNEFSLVNGAMGGKLKGLVELRDGNNGFNFEGTVTRVDPVNNKVTVKVDDEFLKNMSQCKLSDEGGVINIGNTLYYYKGMNFDGNGTDGWSFNPDDNTYTFYLDSSKGPAIDAAKEGKPAQTERGIKYQGIPYYMEQMNWWIRDFAAAVNNIFKAGTDHYGNGGDDTEAGFLFAAAKENGDGQYSEADLTEKGREYYLMTAENFTINTALIGDADLLRTRSNASVGVEECGKIEEMITMLANKDVFSFRNGTAGQFLESILSDISLNSSDARIFYSTYNALKNSIDNQRSSISGVDEDEEAVSLVKFQYSYTLASKMVQTLTEVYDQLILRTGV